MTDAETKAALTPTDAHPGTVRKAAPHHWYSLHHRESKPKIDFLAPISGITAESVSVREETHDAVNAGARLFAEHYRDPWDAEKKGAPKHRMSDTLEGRMKIRGVTRGVAASFGMAGTEMLVAAHYLPACTVDLANMTAEEAAKFNAPLNKGMNFVAKYLYDVPFGAPLRAAFGEDAMKFRRNTSFNPHNPSKKGRDFGSEAFVVTAGFAVASFMDGLGRNLFGVFDPNVKKSWIDQDGHVDWKKAPAAIARSGMRLVLYSAGEDIVAAPAYILGMKGWRHVQEHITPGAGIMLEGNGNGGGFRVDQNGNVLGDYAKHGPIDYQFRFPVYNMITETFRDAVNDVSERIKHRHDPEKPEKQHRPLLGEIAKYTLKTGIDTAMWMMPVMPTFWLARTAQGMTKAPYVFSGKINGEGEKKDGFVFVHSPDGKSERLMAGQAVTPGSTFTIGLTAHDPFHHITEPEAIARLSSTKGPLAVENAHSFTGRLLQPLAQISAKAAEGLGKAANSVIQGAEPKAGSPAAMERYTKRRGNIMGLATQFLYNSEAYTPYMIAKYEAQQIVDTPQEGAATYRALDGAMSGNVKVAFSGIKDMGRAVVGKPVSEATQQAMHEPRGLINSTQMSHDAVEIRDGHIKENYIDRIRAERIAQQHLLQEQSKKTAGNQGDALSGPVLPQLAANSNHISTAPNTNVTVPIVTGRVANDDLGVAKAVS